jgi:hypothetical protein
MNKTILISLASLVVIGGVVVAFGLVVMSVFSARRFLHSQPESLLPMVSAEEVPQPLDVIGSQ